ncbi:hypothetical protein [Lentzea sp.]|uniref:hypothetical protein n=1 Tax=Lentzea sp. TaxID=56099 RepID=UPI002ED4B825
MTSTLPPTRDLPPGRHARIRSEVERGIGSRRRLLVPVLAGAAVVAAVVASVVVFQPSAPPSPAVHITTAPATTVTSVPPEEVKAIESGCSRSAGRTGARLHQYLGEETRWALLYTGDAALTCTLGEDGMAYNAAFVQVAVGWLPGHFSVDGIGTSAGGDVAGRQETAGRPGYRTAVGRIDAKVARVTVTADGRTVDARIADGTYAARLHYPPSWGIPHDDQGMLVQAYDADGRSLGSSTGTWGECYYEPGTSTVLYGDDRIPADRCQPATPWR